MRIKKHPTGNDYILAGDLWVRNFNKSAQPLDINNLISSGDYSLLVMNERLNTALNLQPVETKHRKCVIVSDGHDFKNKHQVLADLKKDVCIIAVNGALAKWGISKKIDYFLANNPYPDVMHDLPKHLYHPKCIASIRTHPDFVKTYAKRSVVYGYVPTPEEKFSPVRSQVAYHIDDYRNPICAAIGMAHRFQADTVALLCCDETLQDERPGSIKLENGLFTYPQHLTAQRLIDANLYWLTHKEENNIRVVSNSGVNYDNAAYIPLEEMVSLLNTDLH